MRSVASADGGKVGELDGASADVGMVHKGSADDGKVDNDPPMTDADDADRDEV